MERARQVGPVRSRRSRVPPTASGSVSGINGVVSAPRIDGVVPAFEIDGVLPAPKINEVVSDTRIVDPASLSWLPEHPQIAAGGCGAAAMAGWALRVKARAAA
jgi:hypothetical protein